MSAEAAQAAETAWTRMLDELERSIPPAPDLVGVTARAAHDAEPTWSAPLDAGPMPGQLAERARGILDLIEERARQTRAVQQEIDRHRGALRESAPLPSTTPLLLDRSA